MNGFVADPRCIHFHLVSVGRRLYCVGLLGITFGGCNEIANCSGRMLRNNVVGDVLFPGHVVTSLAGSTLCVDAGQTTSAPNRKG